MSAMRRLASGGLVQQAIGAIENACLDITAKSLGIPVYRLFGGPLRTRIRLYWSHCGTYRLAWPTELGLPPLRIRPDVVALGKEVRATNVFILGDRPYLHSPGFARHLDRPGFPELNPDRQVLRALQDELAAFREGAGPDMDLLVDLNFKTEGFLAVARAIEPFDIFWVEIDSRDPRALRDIRRQARLPVASGEALFGRRDYKPYLEQHAVDVLIIDAPWNGVAESLKIAAMADAYEINVAPHNFYGHLATMMSAHFCAVVPNFRIMEIDPDRVPWYDELVTTTPEVREGSLGVPTGPGWGTEVNEEAVRAHPPRRR